MVDNRFANDKMQVQRELDEAVEERDRANVKIIGLQAKLRALNSLADQGSLASDDEEMIGLTDAVRSILRLAGRPLQAGEVKTHLDVVGFNFRGSTNPSASVHNTLKRMAATGELVYTADKGYAPHPFNAARDRFVESLKKIRGKTVPMSNPLPAEDSAASRIPSVGQRIFRGRKKN